MRVILDQVAQELPARGGELEMALSVGVGCMPWMVIQVVWLVIPGVRPPELDRAGL